MKILSDTFKIEATYDELLFMYDGMMKILNEEIEEKKKLIAEHKGIPCDREDLFYKMYEQCFELAIILGKKDEFLRKRDKQNKEFI